MMLLLILASLFLSVSSSPTGNSTPVTETNNPSTEPTVGNQTSTVAEGAKNSSSPTTPTVENQTDTLTICDSFDRADHTFLDLLKGLWCIVQKPRVIIAFVTGVLLSATICCLARTCHRKKRRSENLAENMEMVTTEAGALIDDGQAVEFNDCNHDQAAEAAGTSAPDGDQEFKEVEYSDIMFCASQCSLTEARDAQDPTETEYAEIKKGAPEERQDDGGEGGEVLEDNREGEEEMVEEEMETGLSVSAGEEGEEGEVVSKVT
ncbi:uncharacterized protein LOC133965620 [Platichthys flesus]|uniref:uncharacterized protein LOC133965620 n=1 Tax=Platichthys flesus TaxID=8260 RepID=UPI001A8112CB|nr:uncharacterized protein LOC133965620 [Platichthys flesus]XP_062256260.1 uncharacterized protein LOC133965620 [Platichthys flesus]XP_062256261.1 uncharacterized protein LOC133965620 [Platichthys flesus]